MYCLWCMEEMTVNFSWSNFLSLVKPAALCEKCEENLSFLSGSRCEKCSKETKEPICADCMWWMNWKEDDPLTKNISIFNYNSFMKDVIAKWKYRGDYVLGEIFKPYLSSDSIMQLEHLQKEAKAVIPIPLSKERLYERGFNQAEQLAGYLPFKIFDALGRKDNEKQSKKTRHARIFRDNPFYIKQQLNEPVILVDDIYTTGATIRHAASLLKENGCPKVYSITIIRG